MYQLVETLAGIFYIQNTSYNGGDIMNAFLTGLFIVLGILVGLFLVFVVLAKMGIEVLKIISDTIVGIRRNKKDK